MQAYEKEKPILTLSGAKIIEDFERIAKETEAKVSASSTAAKEVPTESEMAALKESQVIKACQTIDWLCAKYAERSAVFELKHSRKRIV
jgi:hypothetical protein